MLLQNKTVFDIIYEFPETKEVFQKYEEDTGICIMCEHLFATINDISIVIKRNVDNILQDLENVANR